MRNLFLLLIGTFLVSEVFPAEIVTEANAPFLSGQYFLCNCVLMDLISTSPVQCWFIKAQSSIYKQNIGNMKSGT